MSEHKDVRGTAWSITYYPPTDSMDREISLREVEEYVKRPLAPGWQVTGQFEQCPRTLRYHYQGMLKTPQVRWRAVKNAMAPAHFEKANSKAALTKYVHKEETRVATVADSEKIPTLFEYQDIIAALWQWDEYRELAEAPANSLTNPNELAMRYVDSLVAYDIETNGRRGAEFIGINPMWRSSWKLFWRSIIHRHASSHQTVHETPAPGEQGPEEGETHSG